MNGTRRGVRGRAAAAGRGVRTVLFFALAGGAVLAGLGSCGDVSLLTVFDEEATAQPIEVQPDGKYLPVTWPITLTVSGGVEPYTYGFEPPVGTWNPDDGSVTYTAPATIKGEVQEVTLVVTDFLGKQKKVKVKVHSPLEVDPPVFTLSTGETQDITLSGGVRDYLFEYGGGGSVVPTANPHVFRYTAPTSPGADAVLFRDATNTSLNTRTVSVTVTSVGALALNPASAVIGPGESVTFVATGGAGSPPSYTVAQTPVDLSYGTTAPAAASEREPITYTAPAVVAGDLLVTITVSDGSSSADFQVQVQAPPTDPLSVVYDPAPQGNKIKIDPDGTVNVTASGGRSPYAFAVPERAGAIVPLPGAPDRAVYTALTGNTRKVSETIVVTDSASPPAVDSVTVEIQKP